MNKRNPYKWGVKDFLASIEKEQEVEVPDSLCYESVKSVACHLNAEYGCKFLFRTEKGKHYAKRVS